MRDLFKVLVVGIIMFFAQTVFAEEYKVLVLPDNIVTETASVDEYIYDAASEFFADGVITILNGTDFIKSPQVSTTRTLYKSDPKAVLTAKAMTSKFRTTYNIDYEAVKKLAAKSGAKYVLLLTSYIDAENYILRRTLWDFLNIAGATVVDPAYKISTYAALVDTSKNQKIWSDTYYKTISVVENRIITRGPSPQVEQLSKIKDYSRYLCPQIAQSVQLNVLPPAVYAKESNQVDYNLGNLDNIFTKKYRHYGKETGKFYREKKEQTKNFIDTKKERHNERKAKKAAEKQLKEAEQQTRLEVKAKPVKIDDEPYTTKINNTQPTTRGNTNPAVFKKTKPQDTTLDGIDIKKSRKNNLFDDSYSDRPRLRGYDYFL